VKDFNDFEIHCFARKYLSTFSVNACVLCILHFTDRSFWGQLSRKFERPYMVLFKSIVLKVCNKPRYLVGATLLILILVVVKRTKVAAS